MTAPTLPEPRLVTLAAPEDPSRAHIILHLDMDSFYASVEVQRKPDLRNKPVVVGADPKGGRGRGVVCTCSYEARAFGIRSAMPVSQAYTLCPHATFLTPDFDQYTRISGEIMDLLRLSGYRSLQVSIDEAFLDISSCGSFAAAAEYARQIQEQIHHRFGLTCSIGIGPGKTIAKIASDYKKPGGVTVVESQAARDFLTPLPVRKIPGVGKKAEALLLELGIRTIGDLAASDIQALLCRFGRGAAHLYELALGIDTSGLEEYDGIKSMSREMTFDADIDDPALLQVSLDCLAAAVHHSLTGEHLRCRTVTVKLRYHDFETRTKSHTLTHYTGEPDSILTSSQALFREMYDGRRVRLIGIRLSSFEKQDSCQMTLGI
jgi:DNA polymerase IV (archaeal DinB-like DNA polymerase)